MEIVPKEITFATAALTGFNRNRYRLETSGATQAGPSSIVTITLPSNAVIDLKSIRIHMDVETFSHTIPAVPANAGTGAAAVPAATVHAKLPADAHSLLSHVEVYAGGIQLTQSCSEYNTVANILKIVRSTKDRDQTVDHVLGHGMIDNDNEQERDTSIVMTDFKGFLGESSTRYLPTSITGDITLRLTFAPQSVLAFKESGKDVGADFSASGITAASLIKPYAVKNIFATCDTVALGDAYEKMLLDRLSSEAFLPVNFKEYYTFAQHGLRDGSHSTKFNLSCSSIDACYAVFRDQNYQTNGIKSRAYSITGTGDGTVANAFFFRSFNSMTSIGADGTRGDAIEATKNRGLMKYHWTVANVRYPQYDATVMDAAADLSLVTDQVRPESRGNLITSLKDYMHGKFIVPLLLNMPGQGINVASGYNSKGSSTQMSLEVSGMTPPTGSTTKQEGTTFSSFVVVETTAQLRISGNRQLAVSY